MRALLAVLALGLPTALVAEDVSIQATSALNVWRAEQGRGGLVTSAALAAVAQGHGDDMARNGFFAHEGSDGSSLGERLRRAGYRFCFAAENIAMGQKDLQGALNAWATSKGHARNMSARQAEEFAVIRASGDRWVMVLAAPGC